MYRKSIYILMILNLKRISLEFIECSNLIKKELLYRVLVFFLKWQPQVLVVSVCGLTDKLQKDSSPKN